MHPVMAWLIFSLCMLPIEEHHNSTHPKPYHLKKYICINWEEEDFIFYEEDGNRKYILKEYRESDSKYKAKARRYWHEQKAK